MKIRNKVILIVTPVMLASILIINFIFSIFFVRFLETYERSQIASVQNSMHSYIDERLSRYQGQVNDWGHWDDTLNFLNGDRSYIELNLTEETFKNLSLNFMVMLDNSGGLYYNRFYDYDNNEFVVPPKRFFDDFKSVAEECYLSEDMSGLYRIGADYYFIASTDVTDSLTRQAASGKLVFGRRIDDEILSDIEKSTESKVISISAGAFTADTDGGIFAADREVFRDEKTVRFESDIESYVKNEAPVMFTLELPRDLYSSGRTELSNFVFGNIAFTVAAVAVLFTILGMFMSKPFTRIINDVKGIDLKRIKKIPVKGKDEFAFLGNAINSMLETIEEEQSKVRANEEKLYATLVSVGDGVIAVDRDSAIEFMNPVAQQLTGWTIEEAKGKCFEEVFNLIHEYSRVKIKSPVTVVFETEKVVELSNHTLLVSRDGKERAIEDTAAPIRDKAGNVAGCVLVFRDFSEKKEKQRRIEYLSYHDQLTGLYNRRFFEEELRRLDTAVNLPISLIYADVNGLKTINDAFGHNSGDELIRQAAQVLTSMCGEGSIISRTGGDEFIILLTNTDGAAAETLVEKIRSEIEKQSIMGVDVSLSFGWDTKDNEEQSIWEMLKNAEDSMYQKKILSSASKRSAVIDSILSALHLMCPPEEAHSKRVGRLCEAIGKAYGLNTDELRELKIAGELHDIGKISMDKAVLNKAEKLTASEWAQIKDHPETGYRILSTSREYYSIAEFVLAHHERWDGAGYPKGLKGEEISWKARIIAVADAYDAMTTTRPYRKPLSRAEAIAEIRKNAGKQFDPEIAKMFTRRVLREDISAEAD